MLTNSSIKYELGAALADRFLGRAPGWYKVAIIAFLVINPILFAGVGAFIAGWILVFEFLFTLAMALKCYPLASGGLLALEAVFIGMVSPDAVYNEVVHNIPVILLLMFMVAGIYFLQDLLLLAFTRILLSVRSRTWLALSFTAAAAFLSAFMDALTVTAVVIAVASGFYTIYHKVASGRQFEDEHDPSDDSHVGEVSIGDLEQFRAFLRTLAMHAAVGTALGGIATLVGEPQNLLIAHMLGWHFIEFFVHVAPVSLPVLVIGLATCVTLQKTRWFGYGVELPESVRRILASHDRDMRGKQTLSDKVAIAIQGIAAVLLLLALALHVAAVGLVGLALLILVTATTGVIEEHRLGQAFTEALPFTALLVVFFAIVAMINTAGLFNPIMDWVLHFSGDARVAMVYIANGVLSMISDNVFVATVYIQQMQAALDSGLINTDQFHTLAVTVNAGTNLPSVATPNGQAAFLFLLTSSLAPLIRLSYGRMVWMALPYTLVLSLAGLLAAVFLL
jgi:NhaB family Na+:H+ antiporter